MIYDYNLNISELWSYPIIQSKNLKYAVDWMGSSEATFRVVSLHFYCDTSLNLIQKIQIYCESHQTHKKKTQKKNSFFSNCVACVASRMKSPCVQYVSWSISTFPSWFHQHASELLIDVCCHAAGLAAWDWDDEIVVQSWAEAKNKWYIDMDTLVKSVWIATVLVDYIQYIYTHSIYIYTYIYIYCTIYIYMLLINQL